MNVTIVCREDDHSRQVAKQVSQKLIDNGVKINDGSPDIVLFIGGDGTFLRAVNNFIEIINNIKFIGIHTGSLGFFCDFSLEEIDSVIRLILSNKRLTREYKLLEATLISGHEKRKYYAVNEIRIENAQHTIITDVLIDDMFFEKFRGNGLLVSSQLGSSGYNKSIGGAVIESGLELLELSEIAPLANNIYRPLNASLILSGTRRITFKGVAGETLVGFDYQSEKIEGNNYTLTVGLSNKKVTLIHNEKRPYLTILNKAFISN